MDAFWSGLNAADAQHIAWWQMCVRAVIVAATGLLLIRMVGARTFSRASPADILVSIILGSNLSRAITGSVQLWPTMLASAVIVLLHALLVRLGVYSHLAGRITKGRTAILVKDGERCDRTLRREGVSRGDLEEVLRSAGLTDVSEVRLAVRERSGKVSVLKYKPADARDRASDTRPKGDLEHAAVADAQGLPQADGPP
ncbi:MAG: DUF421 domain-containing protein [Caulobacteraceae bacterium]|nr:DUF421 domain-containing protein [Caulobacter sp.]